MGASSVTGTGQGICGKATLNDLSQHALGPQIMYAGSVETSESEAFSPPTPSATVTLPIPLPGITSDPGDEYIVMLTPKTSGPAYVIDMDDDDLDEDEEDDHFTGFTIVSEEEGEVFFMVVKKGIRA